MTCVPREPALGLRPGSPKFPQSCLGHSRKSNLPANPSSPSTLCQGTNGGNVKLYRRPQGGYLQVRSVPFGAYCNILQASSCSKGQEATCHRGA